MINPLKALSNMFRPLPQGKPVPGSDTVPAGALDKLPAPLKGLLVTLPAKTGWWEERPDFEAAFLATMKYLYPSEEPEVKAKGK